jgi:hypothetical protein
MKRKLRFLFCLCVVAVLSGCAMCNNCWDDAYNTYGGALDRQDRFHGRVGSVLSDPTLQMAEPGETSEAPTEADLYPDGLTAEGPALEDAEQ